MKPMPYIRNDVPRCTLAECEAYNGKRCLITGDEPEGVCEPSVAWSVFRAALALVDAPSVKSYEALVDAVEGYRERMPTPNGSVLVVKEKHP